MILYKIKGNNHKQSVQYYEEIKNLVFVLQSEWTSNR